MRYMIHYNGAAVYVKEHEFFKAQKAASPEWNTDKWHGPVYADGIEHARLIGQNMVKSGELQ